MHRLDCPTMIYLLLLAPEVLVAETAAMVVWIRAAVMPERIHHHPHRHGTVMRRRGVSVAGAEVYKGQTLLSHWMDLVPDLSIWSLKEVS